MQALFEGIARLLLEHLRAELIGNCVFVLELVAVGSAEALLRVFRRATIDRERRLRGKRENV